MSIEEILKNEGKKQQERGIKNFIICVPSDQAKGICKYKIGEIITLNGGKLRFEYKGPSIDGYDFMYVFAKNETIQ